MREAVPRVSVVVPVRDGAATVRTCLDALVGLDYPASALEIVVVDNRSTDDTRAIVAEYPVRLVEERAVQSSYAARNRGVASSTGEVLAFTDADCVPDPGWVRALVLPLAEPGVGGVAGAIEAFAAESAVERYQARRAIRADHAFAHPMLPFAQTANAAYPRALVERLGGFDASIPFGGDLDFAWRLQRQTGRRLAYAPDALVRHRHRTTWRGVVALYEKNAIANCLLAQRWAYYARYPHLRTFAFCARELARSAWRAVRRAPRSDGGRADEHWVEVARWAGEMRGWLRWRTGRVERPRITIGNPFGAASPAAKGRAA